MSRFLKLVGWPWFGSRHHNPLLADPTYAALQREEETLRRRHMNASHVRARKRELLHQALRRVA